MEHDVSNLEILNRETAPAGAADALDGAEKAFGFIPNLLGVFANSPATLKAYLALGDLMGETQFSDTERQLLLLTVSRFNECHYCIAAHSTVAAMQKIPADVVDAIRNDSVIANAKLQALREFATAMVRERGWVSAADIERFLAVGYTPAHMLEVVLAVSFKTISNYANHIAETPLDKAFAANAWSQPASDVA